MITLFAVPKPFVGGTEIAQRNAIASWIHLEPRIEILLLGDDLGTAEVSADFGLRHLPILERNTFGTPLLDSVFKQAQTAATHSVLAYVNADILLMNDFVEAVQRIPFPRFLMIGRRWNLDVGVSLAFGTPDWSEKLSSLVSAYGRLSGPSWLDYFVFSAGLWDHIPPFALGRTLWDNWLPYQARTSGAAVIDATRIVRAIHQKHDYGHIVTSAEGPWKGVEAATNKSLAQMDDGLLAAYDVREANWVLTERAMLPSFFPSAYQRHILAERWARRSPTLKWVIGVIRDIQRHVFRA